MSNKRGNGEGSIYYSEKLKRWVGQFSAGYDENGKLKRKSVYGKTRREVADKIVKSQNEVNNNTFIDKDNTTLITLVNMIIEEKFKANKITQSSYNRNKETAKIISKMRIADIPIQKITATDINNDLLAITNYSNSVITKVYIIIKKAFDKAILLNILSSSIFFISEAVIKPKSKNEDKKIDALTIDEQKLLVEELKKGYDKYTDIFYIALYTGMRIGEILALSPKDIDLDNKLIHINKTLTKDKNDKSVIGTTTKTYAGTRNIPITKLIENILLKAPYCQNETLFTENSKIIAPPTINSHFKRICKNAGIRIINIKDSHLRKNGEHKNLKSSNVNTHMLRHTYATRAIEAGISAIVLSKLLGHKDISTTLNTYTSVFNKFKEDEIEKLNKYLSKI